MISYLHFKTSGDDLGQGLLKHVPLDNGVDLGGFSRPIMMKL
jgi:hypothetical protein